MNRRGIAAREVVTLLVIGGLLITLLVMWIARVRPESRRNLCERRQQQMTAALLQWESLHGEFPGYRHLQAVDAEGERRANSWVFQTLPYLGYDVAPFDRAGSIDYKAAATNPDVERPYDELFARYGPDGDNVFRGTAPEERIELLLCPDNADLAESGQTNPLSWVVNSGMPDASKEVFESADTPADWAANGVFFDRFTPGAAPVESVGTAYIEQHDGLNTTLLLSERIDAGPWHSSDEAKIAFVWSPGVENGEPSPLPEVTPINERRRGLSGETDFSMPSSYHQGGVIAAYAGGRTQFISEEIDYLVLTRLMTSNDQKVRLPGTGDDLPAVYGEPARPTQ